MALPNPLISTGNSSKLFPIIYDVAGTNTAAVVKAIRVTAVNAENMGHMGVATHAQGTAWAAGDPVVVVVGLDGTTLRPLLVNSSGGLTINGSVSITGTPTVVLGAGAAAIGSVSVTGTVTVATHAVTQSGTWNVGLSAGANNIGDVDILTIAAGANTIGATLDGGWDTAGHAVQRGLQQGLAGDITEKTLLAADASNLYNITDLVLSVYAGSTAPAAVRRLTFRLGAAGTVFHTEYIPPTANAIVTRAIQFKEPVRSSTNQAITVQLDAAGGTSYEYSAIVLAFKTAS